MRFLAMIMLALALGLFGCPDDDPVVDAGTGGRDAGADAGAGKLERPLLERPPDGRLPPELIPPR